MTASQDPVAQALAGYQAAVYAKDVATYAALYDDDVLVFDAWDDWSAQGLDAWRAMAAAWFGSLGDERVVVAFSDVQTRMAFETGKFLLRR